VASAPSVVYKPPGLGDGGRLDADGVAAALRPPLFPYTEVGAISVEETTNRGGGAIHGLGRLRELRRLVDDHGFVLHGDGARLWHALVATGEDPAEVAACFDAFSVCLSKGLGAPIGSLVIGDRDLVDECILWRRRFGGAMRQVGIVAAAGRYALEHHVERLAEDHAHARMLDEVVADTAPSAVDPDEVTTNIVYVSTGDQPAEKLVDALRSDGVLVGAMGPHLLRLITHLDVDAAGVRHAAERLATLLAPA
jgi:threonine aldolase